MLLVSSCLDRFLPIYCFRVKTSVHAKKTSKNDAKATQKRCKSDPKTIQKRSKKDAKATQKRSKNDAKTNMFNFTDPFWIV